MEMPARVHLGDLGPLVLRDFVDLALLGSLIGVLRSYSEQEVLRSVLKPLVQVGKLVAAATVLHHRSFLGLERLFVNDESVIGDDCANLVFLLFSSNAEHLVMNLDADKVLGENFSVADSNLCCCLRSQVVDHKLVRHIIVIVQAWLVLRQNKVRLKTDYVV